MIIKNKLDRTFGPFGSSAGFFLMVGGVMATWFSPFGLIVIAIGSFAAFTSTTTWIDTEKRRIRHTDDLFGICPVGKWIDIQPEMKLGIKNFHRGFVGYIRGTQPMGIHETDIRIILYDTDNEQIMPVKKFKSYVTAEADLVNLSSLLGLKTIGV